MKELSVGTALWPSAAQLANVATIAAKRFATAIALFARKSLRSEVSRSMPLNTKLLIDSSDSIAILYLEASDNEKDVIAHC